MSNNIILNKGYEALIVEDETVLAMSMQLKLKKMGLYSASIASTAESAILFAQNNYPDIAIIDINLNSSKTGIDVANYIWKNLNIPVIFLTSYYNEKILDNAMECEPYAYLLKPCRYNELEAAINMALHKHKFFFKNKDKLNTFSEDFIQIAENIKYDKVNSELYVDSKILKISKNEKKFLELLSKDTSRAVSFDMIFGYIWREDVYDLAKLRSLVYRLKTKVGTSVCENYFEMGYKIKVIKSV